MDAPSPDALFSTMHIFDVTTCDSGKKEVAAPLVKLNGLSRVKESIHQTRLRSLQEKPHARWGESVELLLNGKNICESKAVYGGESATAIIDG